MVFRARYDTVLLLLLLWLLQGSGPSGAAGTTAAASDTAVAAAFASLSPPLLPSYHRQETALDQSSRPYSSLL